MEARIILTHDCNYNCDFCHGEGWFKKKGVFIENTKLFFLIKVLTKWELTNVTLSGGEPLLHPNIGDIINFVHNQNIKVSLVTNGSLVNENGGVLEKVDLINYSIHTMDKNKYLKNSEQRYDLVQAFWNLSGLIDRYPEKDIRVNIIIDRFLIQNIEMCLYKLKGANKIKLIERFPFRDKELSIEFVRDKLKGMGFIEVETQMKRRKIVLTNGMHTIYLTRVFCAQLENLHLKQTYCMENNEINISPEFIIKKCRYSNGVNISSLLEKKEDSKLNEIIGDTINLKEVKCLHE